MTALEPGHTFAGYQLAERVNRGGMGEVWKAIKTGPEGWRKTIALKVILPAMADQGRFSELFMREARIAAQLDHPNIVPVFAFGKEGERLWFEQEFVVGRDLAGWIHPHRLAASGATAGRRFPLPLALYVAGEVLKALDYAHTRIGDDGHPLQIVHRDIKPSNVLVADEGHVKLVDFGIAKITAETTASHSALKGTAGYLAPEVLEGRKATEASDLFGVGAMLWEMLTAGKMFPGPDAAARIRATMQDPIPCLAHADVDAPQALDDFVQRLVARNPFDRPQTADAAYGMLLALPDARAAGSRELREFLTGSAAAGEHAILAAGAPRLRSAKSDGVPVPVEHDAATSGSLPVATAATETARPRRESNDAITTETRPAVPVPAAGTVSASTSPTGTLAGEVSTTVPRPPARSRYLAVAAAALILVAVTSGWLILRAGGSTSATRVVSGTPDASPTDAAKQLAMRIDAATSAPSAPASDEVHVRIVVDPSDAHVTVNGEPLAGASPFTVSAPRGTTLTIDAQKRGYRRARRSIAAVSGDVEIPISLVPARTAKPRAKVPPPQPEQERDRDAIHLPE